MCKLRVIYVTMISWSYVVTMLMVTLMTTESNDECYISGC